MSTLLGTTLNGRYRLEARIGSGGMSTVYRAHRRDAAAPGGDQADEPRDRHRLGPARAVPARGAGGRAALASAHRRGDRLRRGRRAGRTSCSSTSRARRSRSGSAARAACRSTEAVAYAIEIARALGAAHARHIVHRDVKPQNVLIDEEGSGQGHRLRDRPHARRGGADRRRPRARHDRLRLARAGPGPARDRSVGPVLARHRAVRDAHRRGPVQGREPGGGGDEARARGAPRRAGQAARGLRRARRRWSTPRPPSASRTATPTTPS